MTMPVSLSKNNSCIVSEKTLSEEVQSRDGLRMDAAAEARAVAEFVNRVRSRTAARDLLISRYFQKPEFQQERPAKGQAYNVCVVGDRTPLKLQAYNACAGRRECGSPCNPSTCDFWPHCSHQQHRPTEKGEKVDFSYRKSGSQHRGGSPRSHSPHNRISPQNANGSPQEQAGWVRCSPECDSKISDPRRLAPPDSRLRSGASTPVSSSRTTLECQRRVGTPDVGNQVPKNAQSNWDHLRSMSLPKSFLNHGQERQPHNRLAFFLEILYACLFAR